MYYDTFKTINGDIYYDGVDFTIIPRGQDELRQNLEHRLSICKNEWFLNIKEGLDYPAISGKGISDLEIEYAIRECCMQDPRVESVREFYIYRDRRDRYVEINFTVFDKDENRLYMSEVVDFE